MTREELDALKTWIRGYVFLTRWSNSSDAIERELRELDRALDVVMLKGTNDGK